MEGLQSKFVIDLVFTDINLPGEMSGLDLAAWTLANRPGVKVLVTTGDATRAEMIPEAVGALLAKPYTGRDLLDRVQRALMKPVADESEATK